MRDDIEALQTTRAWSAKPCTVAFATVRNAPSVSPVRAPRTGLAGVLRRLAADLNRRVRGQERLVAAGAERCRRSGWRRGGTGRRPWAALFAMALGFLLRHVRFRQRNR